MLFSCILVVANVRLSEWPELNALIGRLAGGDARHVLMALEIIEKLAGKIVLNLLCRQIVVMALTTWFVEYIGEKLTGSLVELLTLIQPTLTSENHNIRVSSARAFLSLLFEVKQVYFLGIRLTLYNLAYDLSL